MRSLGMSIKETEKYIRDSVKHLGLVFRRSKTSNLYVLTDRKTKDVVWSDSTIGSILNNIESGYIDTYCQESKKFKGFNLER